MHEARRLVRAVGLLAVFCGLALLVSAPAHAQAPEIKVLVFHGAPDADDRRGRRGDQGARHGATASPSTRRPTRRAFTADQARDVPRGRVPQHAPATCSARCRRPRSQHYVEGGNGFLGIGSAAAGRARHPLLRRPDRRAPGRREPDDARATPSSTSATACTRRRATCRSQWTRSDVWYQWTTRPTGTVHTVARYRAPDAAAGDGTDVGDTDTPISWCRDYRGGRSFYTGMGRTAASLRRGRLQGAPARRDPVGRRPRARRLQGDDRRQLQGDTHGQRRRRRRPASRPPASRTASTIAPTAGSSTSAAATAAPTPSAARCSASRRRSAHARPRGPERRHRLRQRPHLGSVAPTTAPRTAASRSPARSRSTATAAPAASAPTRPTTRWSTACSASPPSPDFSTTGHIYLQYFPTLQPETRSRPGLPIERRISKMSRPRISRFTINLQTKKLDLDSEVRIFEYDAQIYSAAATSAAAWASTPRATSTSPPATRTRRRAPTATRATTRTPSARPARRPRPSSAHCGAADYSYQDARRTAGNTNDYNGKMLRIKPIATIPDGAQPHGRRRHDVHDPGRRRAQRPEPVQGRPRATAARPGPRSTRWACATRAACRSTRRRTSRTRRGSARTPARRAATEGPSTYENAAQITHAGNYGWPYCMGNKQAYRDRAADGNTLRTDSPDRLRRRRPRHRRHRRLVRLRQPAQRLAQQHRPASCSRTRPARARTPARCAATTSGTAAATRATATAARSSRARAAPARRPTTARTNDVSCARTRPRQRHDDHGRPGLPLRRRRGRQLARAGPSTGTAAGSCTTTAAPSIKHGLLLDPDTDQDGGLPVYADSLRDTLIGWTGTYMDSKFGPDGALYVQTYDGFFRAGPDVGIYRYDYIGGPDDPDGRAAGRRRSERARSASPARARAACRTSGTSVTARRPRPRPTRRTRIRGQATTRPS